jgi:P pilus assembly chaperone PapD
MQGTNRMIRRWPSALMAVVTLLGAGVTSAGVVMNATRYIYDANAKEITVKVSNNGKLPVLTQAWIDDGDARSTPEHVNVPFNLTPPIARVERGKSQTLRISHTGGTMPADRESQYWINVLEVPPKAEDSKDSSKMQLAFRYRLKLFYRPEGLPGSAAAAPDKLSWTRAADGGLSVSNPSAYHVTLNDVRLGVDGREVSVEPFAIAPFASSTRKLESALPSAGEIKLHYQSINDYGGFATYDKTVGSP